MPSYNLGRVLLLFRGNYSSTTTYTQLDVVYYNGSSYVAKTTTTGNAPTNTTYWQIMALKGELSPTLSPEQVTSIINQIEAEAGFVRDSNYIHTDNNFTNEYRNAIDNLNDETITISANNTPIGTFTTNQNHASTINITIPTNISQLSGSQTLLNQMEYAEIINPQENLNPLKSGHFYECTAPMDSIDIVDLEYNNKYDGASLMPTVIDFEVGPNGFTLTLPPYVKEKVNNPSVYNVGHEYRLTFENLILTIEEII